MIKIEKVKTLEMTTQEARAFMVNWYRVVEEDGSTIAYVADLTTAQQIQDMIERTRFGLMAADERAE